MKKPLGRQKDPGKRTRILAAARTLFLRSGYDATSIEAIASEAGVSKVTVYGHFGTLEALLHAVVVAEAAAINAALAHPPVQQGSLAEDLTDFGFHLLKMLRQRRTLDFEHLIAAQATRQPTLAKTYYTSGPERGMQLLANIMKPHIGEKAEEAARMLFALWSGGDMHQVAVGLRAPLSDEEIARHVHRCVSVIVKAYEADDV